MPALEGRMRILRLASDTGSFVDTTGSFEEYQSRMSSSFRRSLRSARRKAEQEHVLDFEVVSGPDAADDQLLADFFRVEAAGWKGQAGSAIACHPDRVAFYTALARRLARRGWLEWNLARFDGTVVAAHFGVRFGPSLVLPKGGYDESFNRFAPGNLLFWDVFSRSFANGTEEVNFLTDKPWMRIWKMNASQYHNLIVTPRHHPVAATTSLLTAAEVRRHASEYAQQHQTRMRDLVQKARTRRRGGASTGTT
jgi:CelD/BcsL family acetyltransferase involved in cellulose biosynthesis